MNKTLIKTALAYVLIVFSAQAATKPYNSSLNTAEIRSVIVQHVLDGDTFVTTNNEHIRVWGINSPERDETGYWAAGLFMDMKIRGQELRCKQMDIDKYSRTVMKGATLGGIDIGSYMVETGYARDFTKYSDGFYKPEEKAAKIGKRGLWNPESGYSPKLKYTP